MIHSDIAEPQAYKRAEDKADKADLREKSERAISKLTKGRSNAESIYSDHNLGPHVVVATKA